MTSAHLAMTLTVVLGLALAALLHARAISKVIPFLEAAARSRAGSVRRSLLGMPQLLWRVGGMDLRLTPMNKSISSPEGGGGVTCVDFEVAPGAIRPLRIQERGASLRMALPGVLAGDSQPFTLGIPEFDSRLRACASDVEQARRILGDRSLIGAILALPQGADIHVERNRCRVAVDGLPDSADFVDRLVGVSERLIRSLGSDPPRP